MGMSTEEFEHQKADTSRRFYIDHTKNHMETSRYDDDFSWCVVDRSTGEVIGYDGGEPEDQILVRDWAWVCEALNKVATDARDATIANLKRQVEEMRAKEQCALDMMHEAIRREHAIYTERDNALAALEKIEAERDSLRAELAKVEADIEGDAFGWGEK